MKTIVSLFLILLTSQVLAGTRLVVNLDGILVQGIPYRNASSFPASSLVKTGAGKYFVKLPQADEFLSLVAQNKLVNKIVFTGSRSASENKEIVQAFDDELQGLSIEVKGDELANLATKSSWSDFIIVVSEKDLPAATVVPKGSQLVVMKPTFFHFPDYATARVGDPTTTDYPQNEDEWALHLNKRGRLYFLLMSLAEVKKNADKARELSRLLSLDSKVQGEQGVKMLTSGGQWIAWSWQLQDDKIVACVREDIKTAQTQRIFDLESCSQNFKINTYWDGPREDNCVLTTADNTFITVAGQSPCADTKLHRFVSKKDGVLIVKSFDGMDRMSVDEIFERFARKASFRKLLSDPAKSANMIGELGRACAEAINAITASGGNLESKILKDSTQTLDSFHVYSKHDDDVFYHWTKSTTLLSSLKLDKLPGPKAYEADVADGSLEAIFDFLRTQYVDGSEFYRRVLYVAEDKDSSSDYGNLLIEFQFNPKAVVLPYDESTWSKAVQEVANRYSSIAKNCKVDLSSSFDGKFGVMKFNNLFFIIAEDSSVDLIDYNQQRIWFQLLSPKSIIGIKRGN